MGVISEEMTTMQSECIPSSSPCDNCMINCQLPNRRGMYYGCAVAANEQNISTLDNYCCPWWTKHKYHWQLLLPLTTKASPDKANRSTPDNQLLPQQPKWHYEEDKNPRSSEVEWVPHHKTTTRWLNKTSLTDLLPSYGPTKHCWILGGDYPCFMNCLLGFHSLQSPPSLHSLAVQNL